MKNDNPCYFCVPPERHIGCHSSCEKHIQHSAEHKAKQQIIRKKKLQDRDFRNYEAEAYERIIKR